METHLDANSVLDLLQSSLGKNTTAGPEEIESIAAVHFEPGDRADELGFLLRLAGLLRAVLVGRVGRQLEFLDVLQVSDVLGEKGIDGFWRRFLLYQKIDDGFLVEDPEKNEVRVFKLKAEECHAREI